VIIYVHCLLFNNLNAYGRIEKFLQEVTPRLMQQLLMTQKCFVDIRREEGRMYVEE